MCSSLADCGLKRELRATWQKFRPTTVARQALKISPGESKKSLVKIAKAAVGEKVNSSSLDHPQKSKEAIQPK